MTWGEVISQSMRKVGLIRPGATAPPEFVAEALVECQRIVDEYNGDRAMQFTVPDYVYNINGSGTATVSPTGGGAPGYGYTIGASGADLTGPRPTEIVRCNLVLLNNPTMPVRIQIPVLTAEQWAAITVRDLTPISTVTFIYYEPRWPNGVIWLWPPMSSGNQIELFVAGSITAPTATSNTFTYPPIYHSAFTARLAAYLWPLTDRSLGHNKLNQAVFLNQAYAFESKIRAVNTRIPTLGTDFGPSNGPGGSYDRTVVLTGLPT